MSDSKIVSHVEFVAMSDEERAVVWSTMSYEDRQAWWVALSPEERRSWGNPRWNEPPLKLMPPGAGMRGPSNYYPAEGSKSKSSNPLRETLSKVSV